LPRVERERDGVRGCLALAWTESTEARGHDGLSARGGEPPA
jgi:hypothetical protein